MRTDHVCAAGYGAWSPLVIVACLEKEYEDIRYEKPAYEKSRKYVFLALPAAKVSASLRLRVSAMSAKEVNIDQAVSAVCSHDHRDFF